MLGASVWVGGPLVLATTVLPRALRDDDPFIIKRFEESFARIGVPALLLQIATRRRLASLYVPPSRWFSLVDHASQHIAPKVGCLLATLLLAAHARLSIIPRLARGAPLRSLAVHITLVTLLAVALAVVGVRFRVGGLFAG